MTLSTVATAIPAAKAEKADYLGEGTGPLPMWR